MAISAPCSAFLHNLLYMAKRAAWSGTGTAPCGTARDINTGTTLGGTSRAVSCLWARSALQGLPRHPTKAEFDVASPTAAVKVAGAPSRRSGPTWH
jgi:hypothetical protein